MLKVNAVTLPAVQALIQEFAGVEPQISKSRSTVKVEVKGQEVSLTVGKTYDVTLHNSELTITANTKKPTSQILKAQGPKGFTFQPREVTTESPYTGHEEPLSDEPAQIQS